MNISLYLAHCSFIAVSLSLVGSRSREILNSDYSERPNRGLRLPGWEGVSKTNHIQINYYIHVTHPFALAHTNPWVHQQLNNRTIENQTISQHPSRPHHHHRQTSICVVRWMDFEFEHCYSRRRPISMKYSALMIYIYCFKALLNSAFIYNANVSPYEIYIFLERISRFRIYLDS